MQQSIEQAKEEKFLELTKWANHTIARIRKNFDKQKVWPMGFPGPYKGYAGTERSKGSTGESYSPRRLYAQVYNMAGGDTERITFFFRYYLYYVDMGVGRGKHWKFENEDAYYNRLFRKWQGEGDRQQRPFLTMEIRHQLRRLEGILLAYYSEVIETKIVTDLVGEDVE